MEVVGATLNSTPIKRKWWAPGAVFKTGSAFGVKSFGIRAEWEGVRRVPAGGSSASLADVRMVIQFVDPAFFGSTKLPVNVAPALRRITSPGAACSSAD